jgi:hypothetical protein
MQAQDPLTSLQAIPEAWATAALARRREQLEQIVQAERESERWNAAQALRCAHLWLAAGLPGLGDDLVLEADQLAPEAGLIPDWWGLWPAADAGPDQATPPPEQMQTRELVSLYLQLRHLPPQPLLDLWCAAVQASPARLDEPALRVLLGVVIQGRSRLERSLEQALAETVGEELVQCEPALTYRLFDPLCERLPAWSYARLKAADLALQRGELERCQGHLVAASAEQRQLPWLHDIAARLALAHSNVQAALAAWQLAIEAAGADAELVELFRQRAREARRGPGVLQARSLLNRGEASAAISLLEALLAQDPQWQPLRSLLEQARQNGNPAAPAADAAPEACGDELARLQARLQELAQRAGMAWPPEQLEATPAETRDAAGLARFLQGALGRLALLG